MKVIKYPDCGRIIKVNDSAEIDKHEVVGCGLKEGCFIWCSECSQEYGSEGCKEVRETGDLTLTIVADIQEEDRQ